MFDASRLYNPAHSSDSWEEWTDRTIAGARKVHRTCVLHPLRHDDRAPLAQHSCTTPVGLLAAADPETPHRTGPDRPDRKPVRTRTVAGGTINRSLNYSHYD